MQSINRRSFLKTTLSVSAATGLTGLPQLGFAQTGGEVVVVGGGSGGATAARYIKLVDPNINVTLIERNPLYHTCFMSNEVIAGERAIEDIQVGYDGLAAAGVDVVQGEVTAIDGTAATVSTSDGKSFPFDRCIVAPGIGFRWEDVDGYDETAAETIPHAWQAGAQTLILRDQLAAMADGGTVLVCPPVKPFRAGSGPYERVSLIAHYLKQNKPGSKIIIVDANPSFSMQAGFEQGWSALYGYGAGSMIEWRPEDAVVAVDVANRTVTTAGGNSVQGDVINLIPPQQAGTIAFTAGLTDDSGWCPVNKRTFESLQVANVHVIGDAAIASGLPKSAYAANVEGKACAAAIVALLNGQQPGTPAFAAVGLVEDQHPNLTLIAHLRNKIQGHDIVVPSRAQHICDHSLASRPQPV
jgi:sulfide dehydrogenase [flavocytochrome c] flavoprotein subunit